jgi:hypothetical protein
MTAHHEDVSRMSIHIDSCAERETLVITTGSSVYELIVLQDDGDVLVRGGRQFTEFRRVLFLGSTAEGGPVDERTLDVGLRMMFIVGDRLLITSAVQSIFRPHARAALTECAAAQ